MCLFRYDLYHFYHYKKCAMCENYHDKEDTNRLAFISSLSISYHYMFSKGTLPKKLLRYSPAKCYNQIIGLFMSTGTCFGTSRPNHDQSDHANSMAFVVVMTGSVIQSPRSYVTTPLAYSNTTPHCRFCVNCCCWLFVYFPYQCGNMSIAWLSKPLLPIKNYIIQLILRKAVFQLVFSKN